MGCQALQNVLKRCSSGTALRGGTFKELDKTEFEKNKTNQKKGCSRITKSTLWD